VARDPDTVTREPGLLSTALPIFYFEEISRLEGMSRDELRAIVRVKLTFPGATVIQ